MKNRGFGDLFGDLKKSEYWASIILFGGSFAENVAEMFEITIQAWKILDPAAPIGVFGSACLLLPNEEILVLGPSSAGESNSSFVYNVAENKWRQVGDSHFPRGESSLVSLGSRIFAIGGYTNPEAVEEFDLSSETWTVMESSVLASRNLASIIPVPGQLFSHLPGGCEGIP